MKPKKPNQSINGGLPLLYFLHVQEKRREQKEIKPKGSKTNGVKGAVA